MHARAPMPRSVRWSRDATHSMISRDREATAIDHCARVLVTMSRLPPHHEGGPMAQFPSGTVTFLFTDIEHSTHLLQRLGSAYAEALGQHQALLRAAFAAHAGAEVDTQGDAFFVAFPTAPDAVAAAAEATQALAAHPWLEGGAVRARM